MTDILWARDALLTIDGTGVCVELSLHPLAPFIVLFLLSNYNLLI